VFYDITKVLKTLSENLWELRNLESELREPKPLRPIEQIGKTSQSYLRGVLEELSDSRALEGCLW
jgi:hypothetical protein